MENFTAGIIDHDSISGAREFLAAAELVGMPVTVGMECHVSMDDFRRCRAGAPTTPIRWASAI